MFVHRLCSQNTNNGDRKKKGGAYSVNHQNVIFERWLAFDSGLDD